MQANPKAKLVVCSAVGASGSINQYGFMNKTFGRLVLKHVLKDHTGQETAVKESDLKWVIVRAAVLNNKGLTEKYRISEPEKPFKATKISRADVAHFLLRAAQEDAWENSVVSISM